MLSCRSCGHPSHKRWEEEEAEEDVEEEEAAEEMLKSKHLQDRLKI